MRRNCFKILLLICACAANFSCRFIHADAKPNDADAPVSSDDANRNSPPFVTKEPEKYAAQIVFQSKLAPNAANIVEQTYFVAREAMNRRLDFELGKTKITNLQLSDKRQIISLPDKKVYTELDASDEKMFIGESPELSLEQLLNAKPQGATFRKIGAETINGRATTKYRLDYGAIREAPEARTETVVWIDETLGLPIKTEVVALENNQPNGAISTVELREIKPEVEPKTFDVPKDFRQITFAEMQKLINQDKN